MLITTTTPLFPLISSLGVPFSRESSFTYSTVGSNSLVTYLDLVPTFTIVFPAGIISTLSEISLTSPVFGFTLYVILLTLEPLFPLSSSLTVPFSRESSLTYSTVGSITSVTTLSLAPSLACTDSVVFSVSLPVLESTS